MRRHACLSCWMIARRIVALTSIAAVSATLGLAQNSDANAYRMPPKAVADLIDASPTPGVSFSPDKSYMIIMDRPSMPPIAELAQPELRLAGTRINPRTNGRSRGRYSIRLTIKDVADGREQIIAGMPDEARIGNVSWSPDDKSLVVDESSRAFLWDARTGERLREFRQPLESDTASLSPDGKILATGDVLHAGLGKMRLWNSQTGELLFSGFGHTARPSHQTVEQ